MKNTRLVERTELQFRADMFNVFNNGPPSQIGTFGLRVIQMPWRLNFRSPLREAEQRRRRTVDGSSLGLLAPILARHFSPCLGGRRNCRCDIAARGSS